MSVNVTKSVSLTKFKATHNTSKILIKLSKVSGKHYATTEDSEFIGMLLPDFDKAKPAFVITFLNAETGESWQAIGNESTASAPEYTL
jgi:hypothetical protein